MQPTGVLNFLALCFSPPPHPPTPTLPSVSNKCVYLCAFFHSPPYSLETQSLAEPAARLVASKLQASSWFRLPQCWEVKGIHVATLGVGIQTQVLMFAQQVYPLSHLPQPQPPSILHQSASLCPPPPLSTDLQHDFLSQIPYFLYLASDTYTHHTHTHTHTCV
jgi:hypothetical protein